MQSEINNPTQPETTEPIEAKYIKPQPNNPLNWLPRGKPLAVWIDWLTNNPFNQKHQLNADLIDLIENFKCGQSREQMILIYNTPVPSLAEWLISQFNFEETAKGSIYWMERYEDIKELEFKAKPSLLDWSIYLKNCNQYVLAECINRQIRKADIFPELKAEFLSYFIASYFGCWSELEEGFYYWNEIFEKVKDLESQNLR